MGTVPSAAVCAPVFEVDPLTHCIRDLDWLESPNADARPDPGDISLLVVHAISLPPGELGGAHNRRYIGDLFMNRLDRAAHPYFAGLAELRVSAHLCVFRDGSATQFVSFDRRAWHAGESWFDGRSRCNDFSIGIELEGCDEQPFGDAQYVTLARLVNAAMRTYPALRRERIVGHADIAPLRKTDPGPHFDWCRLHFEMEFPR
jgi:AmpD protein